MSKWEVLITDEFKAWYLEDLTDDQRARITDTVTLLEEHGPTLRRPAVGEVIGSKHDPQMKELRAGSIRILFAFDPRQAAILLLGGDKRGEWKRWYRDAIKRADRLYDEYLDELRKDGLI